MQCPVCQEVTLVMADRQGIEVDYCPQCRGVWLDRGELEKLLGGVRGVEEDWHQDSERESRHYGKPYHRKKKFDFFDIFD